MSVHPSVRSAAAGRLPPWARVEPTRRRHLERVATLVTEWARASGLPEEDVVRCRAAAFLHDALRDEAPERLRELLTDPEEASLPGPLLHGPASAGRLRADGVADEELLAAIRHHTTGHPDFGRVGLLLFLADFLEPGRPHEQEWRAALRVRMPDGLGEVLVAVLAARIEHELRERRPLHPGTIGLWNRAAPDAAAP